LQASAGPIVTTSCIYIGVDQTWYSGGSWTRPIFNLDNPLSNGRPSSCTYDESIGGVFGSYANYLILDNFEETGLCWNTNSLSDNMDLDGTMVEVSNWYVHGWTFGASSTLDNKTMIAGDSTAGYALVKGLVCDGSDASLGNSTTYSSGDCIGGLGVSLEVEQSVFNHVSNGCVCGAYSVHDNLFENMYGSQGTTHTNIVEQDNGGGNTQPYPTYFYNNVIHDIYLGVGVWLTPGVGDNAYIFNNVIYNNHNNCFLVSGNGTSGVSNYYFKNNTLDYTVGGCNFIIDSQMTSNAINGTIFFQNNHGIGYSPAAWSSVWGTTGTPVSQTVTDLGDETMQSEAAANAQGYTTANNYAPTNSGGATVGAGANVASSCSTFSPDLALCSGTSGGVLEQSGSGGKIAVYSVGAPPRNLPADCTPIADVTGCWDVGAYLFSSGIVSQPIAPTGLVASSQ